ncbi:hypothetical protein SBA5_110122 [Candidatus Sulfotelmatomonas gaucii]|uniref:Uncharacterized protein n=1 Tax=Candidatus Sulfuritelmatomonas gaucii TaxID=2043161 RepID=A0A2N9L373_9BACT|nr:hypothetical protein SBA5_110122 [Candidatus Sulfotelmatomonas gaucii]
MCLRNLGGKRAQILMKTGAAELNGLKFYQVLNQSLHQ